MCRDERLHERCLFSYRVFADITMFIMMQSSFMFEHCNIGFAYNAFRVLFIPFFSCRKKQLKVERVYIFRIFQVRFETFDEVVPEQESVFIKEPWETHMRKRTQSGKKMTAFTFYLKVNKVTKL